MMLNSVDLPQPDGPITARNSPGATSNDMSSTAVSTPSGVSKRLTTSSTTSSAFAAAACGGAAIARGDDDIASRSSAPARVMAAVIDRRVARLDAHIDDRDAAGLDRGDRLRERRRELGRLA